jgi:hypothetical protein
MSQDLTTADIAARQGDERQREDDATARSTPAAATGERSTLFDGAASDRLRARWTEAQTAFVDAPQQAVQDADALVAELMRQLADTFAQERAALERQWARGEDVTTEDLRVLLQRYRSFFERLLDA